ncbi:MAG: FAD-dependent oxidoreductase [Balneolales bacterium]|nr:FAD-dependent oxidoreductase [Balneolales bacterium]
MLIGIIGAGLAGLTAARELAKAGHETIVFEKSRGYGGRLSTRYSPDNSNVRYDHGAPFISGKDPRFMKLISELEAKNVVKLWCDRFSFHDGDILHNEHPNRPVTPIYAAENGMNAIGKYLSRWSDVRTNSKVIGFTYVGDKRTTKRAWMLNLESSEVVEVDALIIATPSVQTYGLIENSTDETMFKAVIKDLHGIYYRPKHSLMLSYDQAPVPAFNGMIVGNNPVITWVSNESSKRNNDGKTSLVVHSNGDFSKKRILNDVSDEVIASEMLVALRALLGDWAGRYDEMMIHRWRYSQPVNFFKANFVELGQDKAPVALIGDFLNGQTLEDAYISGYELAQHWASKL